MRFAAGKRSKCQESSARKGQRVHDHSELRGKRRMHCVTFAAVCVVSAPQRDQPAAAIAHLLAHARHCCALTRPCHTGIAPGSGFSSIWNPQAPS